MVAHIECALRAEYDGDTFFQNRFKLQHAFCPVGHIIPFHQYHGIAVQETKQGYPGHFGLAQYPEPLVPDALEQYRDIEERDMVEYEYILFTGIMRRLVKGTMKDPEGEEDEIGPAAA
jgi:hypothetical protein